ncbi:hypothetical protein [Flavobacterium gilvum]|uniref:Outer membrane protein beta-barrel domain-containing protein n=1 Tax=Flavobacterium gilvum TaxID=1492737 RepID=A0AAC9N6X7_9FLAO|nr:hypothetical protein [Flavobacterium gilvum]AOW09553.1 hypothetical protein EM308_08590 [Flavobacterium gilvum]KFC58969.1 hypothetical protein FEM08_22340 [Flavobacterium gilvum]
MKKTKMLLVLAISVFFVGNVEAQETNKESTVYEKGFRLGLGLNGGLPYNNDFHNWSLGGDVRLQYNLSKKTSVALTTGFTNLFRGNDMKDLGFIPIKAGFKGFVWKNKFYLLGEVGGGIAVTNGYNQNTYLWVPGIGYATKYIDVSLRYENYTEYNTDQFALRVAYAFKL